MEYDETWLSKQCFIEGGYYIKKGDIITKTIVNEMTILFPNVKRVKREEATIIYRIIENQKLGEEGYMIIKREDIYEINGNSTKALLYGMYAFHRKLIFNKSIDFPIVSVPDQNIRMIDHWDNFDGSIERGYAGASIFYDHDTFRNDFARVRQYARMLSSIGINALALNNVNVHKLETTFITEAQLWKLKPTVELFREYGIKCFLAVNYAAPILIGNLYSANPCDTQVAEWWKETAALVYGIIPSFGGFLVKADSEGEPGPFTYGCNHDDGANVLARAVKPFDGVIIWRCFVYNCQQDWRDRSVDRARAQYDHFIGLDGKFDDNVILQIKNGPIDFQVREPVSPLFGALQKCNQMLEFQITQEYTGQQKHVFYLVPMWKRVLDFNTGYKKAGGEVRNIIKDNSVEQWCSGIAAVSNVGMDYNWTGHKLAQANLYGFGRLIWDNSLNAEEIANEWVSLTFNLSRGGMKKVEFILLTSGQTYEDYTAPNGIGFMVQPNHHYGPAVDGYEYDRWGTYHYADRDGIGVDRTLKSGTGFTRQYADINFELYENIHTCPDELLLFFHHVLYTYLLHTHKTLIQSIYDTHFSGVDSVKEYIEIWQTLSGELDRESYENVRQRLNEQLRSAVEWRDQINTYFYRKSGISDEKGRKIYS